MPRKCWHHYCSYWRERKRRRYHGHAHVDAARVDGGFFSLTTLARVVQGEDMAADETLTESAAYTTETAFRASTACRPSTGCRVTTACRAFNGNANANGLSLLYRPPDVERPGLEHRSDDDADGPSRGQVRRVVRARQRADPHQGRPHREEPQLRRVDEPRAQLARRRAEPVRGGERLRVRPRAHEHGGHARPALDGLRGVVDRLGTELVVSGSGRRRTSAT